MKRIKKEYVGLSLLGWVLIIAVLHYTSFTDEINKSQNEYRQVFQIMELINKRIEKSKTVYPVDLRIIVIVFNRAKSMLRLLDSLNFAEYGDDSVKVEVWFDRSLDGLVDQITLETANSFVFKHGNYSVYTHDKHVGIYGQWLSTWVPCIDSSEIAVILEDDLTVSPLFYKYLKLVHKKYDHSREINGYSLQGISIKHGGSGTSRLAVPLANTVFLYPVLGTWGFSPNTRNWVTFLNWFSKAYANETFQPYVPGNIVTKWYKALQKQGKAGGVWSIWHIYHAWKAKEYTLYSNFEGGLHNML